MVKKHEIAAGRRPGRPPVNFARRRDEIIQDATKLFAERGFHGTSMADICKAANIGRGVLYHYISSKEDLLLAIHERSAEPLLARTQEVVSRRKPADLILRDLSRVLMQTISEYLYEVTVFLHEWRALANNQADWSKVRGKRRQIERTIEETIEKGQRQGLFRDTDPRLATLAFLGMHNYAYQWLNPRGRLSPEEIADLFSSIFISGICVQRSQA